jgi:glycosyltransferase involved in cell wall biosynthesis
MLNQGPYKAKVSFFMPNFEVGGIEVSFKQLCNNLISRVEKVDLVYCKNTGPLRKDFHNSVNLVSLEAIRIIPVIWAIKKYFDKHQPDVFITSMYMLGNASIIARFLSKSNPKIIIGARSSFSKIVENEAGIFQGKILKLLSRILFPLADQIISVSHGVEADLCKNLQINSNLVKTIYNPVLDSRHNKDHLPIPEHEWFANANRDYKILICIGRLSSEKGFSEVISVISKIHNECKLRLIIIGEGKLEIKLAQQITRLKLSKKIQIINFQQNYLSYLAHSDIFILNSQFEGLPAVLIEAMALKLKIVSSDCDFGPREILENGKYGILFPTGDLNALKKGILKSIKNEERIVYNTENSPFSANISSELYLKEIKNLSR